MYSDSEAARTKLHVETRSALTEAQATAREALWALLNVCDWWDELEKASDSHARDACRSGMISAVVKARALLKRTE